MKTLTATEATALIIRMPHDQQLVASLPAKFRCYALPSDIYAPADDLSATTDWHAKTAVHIQYLDSRTNRRVMVHYSSVADAVSFLPKLESEFATKYAGKTTFAAKNAALALAELHELACFADSFRAINPCYETIKKAMAYHAANDAYETAMLAATK